jgi:hypothetical protein
MFRNLIVNIFIGVYASGIKKGASIDLSPPINMDRSNIINTSNGADQVTQSNLNNNYSHFTYDNNSKFNILEKLKNEYSQQYIDKNKFINKNYIMETIKKYYNHENLGTLSYDDPRNSIAMLFADW